MPIRALALIALILSSALPGPCYAADPEPLPGLHAEAVLVRDGAGIAHLQGADEHDLFFMQGWVHAQDRLFQMDISRRQASGTLAELLGAGALPQDFEMRKYGLRRAAALSLKVLSSRASAVSPSR